MSFKLGTEERASGGRLFVDHTAERPQIDQCVGHQFHAVVPLLFELEAQQYPLEFVLPREGALHT